MQFSSIFLLICLASRSLAMSEPQEESFVANTAADPSTTATGDGGDLNLVALLDRLRFYNYLSAVDFANLTYFLRTENLTVFVPTNAVFDAIGQAQRDYFMANLTVFQDLMNFHMVQGGYSTENLKNDQSLVTRHHGISGRFNIYNHTKVHHVKVPDIITYSGAVLNGANYSATNGFVYVIDSLLDFHVIPKLTTLEFVNKQVGLGKFAQIVAAAHQDKISKVLDDPATPHTLFAPNDKGVDKLGPRFQKIIHDADLATLVVLFHVTQFGAQYTNGMVNGSNIIMYNWRRTISVKKNETDVCLDTHVCMVTRDNATTTGLLHIVDDVFHIPGVWNGTENDHEQPLVLSSV